MAFFLYYMYKIKILISIQLFIHIYYIAILRFRINGVLSLHCILTITALRDNFAKHGPSQLNNIAF